MSDLASLMKIAPGTASFMLGENQAQARQSEALRQQELAQLISSRMADAAHKQQLNPLELESKQLANQYDREGKLPHVLQQIEQLGLTNAFNKATQPQHIAATNSDYEEKIGANEKKERDRFTQTLIDIGQELEGTPAPQRMMQLRASLQNAKINPDSPMAQQWLNRLKEVDPVALPKYFSDLSNQLGQVKANQTPAYRQSIDTATINKEAQERIAKGNNATSIEVARINAKSRLDTAAKRAASANDILARIKSGQVSYEKGAVQFEIMSQFEEDEIKAAQYAKIARALQEADLKKKREAAQGRVDPNSVGVETVVPQEANLGDRNSGNPQVAAPVADMAKRSWGSYEPDKYEYRVLNGKLQRKAK
jgi:hypothetical protein